MNRKKLLVLLPLIAMVFACNKSEESNSTSNQSSQNPSSSSSSSSSSSESEEKELDENEIIELLNDDENVVYGQTPTGENHDREFNNPKTKPLELKESYLETFDNIYESRITLGPTGDNAQAYLLPGSDENSLNGTQCVMLDSQGNYDGLTFAGMKFSANCTYLVEFDYKVIVPSNDFIVQFRTYKGGYDKDVYKEFNAGAQVKGNFSYYYDLSNFDDFKLSIFPRNNAGSLVLDNLRITRYYSKPMLSEQEISYSSLTIGSKAKFNYKFNDPNGLFQEKETTYYWYSALDKQGLNKTILSRNENEITLTSDEIGKYIGINAKTTSNMDVNDPWSVEGKQIESSESSIYTSKTVNDTSAGISLTHEFTPNVALLENFEDDNPLHSNIYFKDSSSSAMSYMVKDNALNGNKSLYIKSLGSFSGINTSGYRMKSGKRYIISFDYMFMKLSNTFYIQCRCDAGTSFDVFNQIDMASTPLNVKKHYEGSFALNAKDGYYLQFFGASEGYEMLIDDLSIVEVDEAIVDSEPTTNPEKLTNPGDFALETFGQTANKVLNYNSNDVSYDSIMDSYVYNFVTNGNREIYINFFHNLLTNSQYLVEFDYVVKKKGTGNFYIDLYYSTGNNDKIEKQVEDLSVNVKKHFSMSCDLSSYDPTSSFIKIFTYYASGEFEIAIDNFKLTKIN